MGMAGAWEAFEVLYLTSPINNKSCKKQCISMFLKYFCFVFSNGTSLIDEERTESPVSPKSEEIEQEVEIEHQFEVKKLQESSMAIWWG